MIRPTNKTQYDIRQSGHPMLHEELEWYVDDNYAVLGVLIRDKIDDDFSWVVLTQNKQGPGFTAVDQQASLPTPKDARVALFAAMVRAR
jgi:hypothetical protein